MTDPLIERGGLQALRTLNRIAVLNCLRDSGRELTVTDLHRSTTLSRPTVKLALGDLLRDGLIVSPEELGGTTLRGGRPARRYTYNAHSGYVVGVVIGMQRIEVALADMTGTIVARQEVPAASGIERRSQLHVALLKIIEKTGLQLGCVRSMTIGTLGIVTPNGVAMRNETVPELSQEGYFESLRSDLPFPVAIENDANLAAAAEFAARSAIEVTDMVGLHVNTAIGSGVVLDSKLYRGANGAAGEMGFDQRMGWDKSHEVLVQAADDHNVSVRALFRLAGEGAAWASDCVEQFADAVAPGVIALLLTLDPPLMVIGGDVCLAENVFGSRLIQALEVVLPVVPAISFSTLGRDCVLLGAIQRSLDEAHQNQTNQEISERPDLR